MPVGLSSCDCSLFPFFFPLFGSKPAVGHAAAHILPPPHRNTLQARPHRHTQTHACGLSAVAFVACAPICFFRRAELERAWNELCVCSSCSCLCRYVPVCPPAVSLPVFCVAVWDMPSLALRLCAGSASVPLSCCGSLSVPTWLYVPCPHLPLAVFSHIFRPPSLHLLLAGFLLCIGMMRFVATSSAPCGQP